MYTREQASQIRQQFWTRFGKYMAPVLSSEGYSTNWINYKTGIRNLYFRMDANKKQASIAIEMMYREPEFAEKIYQQFSLLKFQLEDHTGEEWIWHREDTNEHGQTLSRIYCTREPLNIFKETDWPDIISFLKPRIMALDAFWNEYKMVFEMIS
ncbi:MAG: DUF4268 domain-containing protein [Ferruginibacter sp.]